MRKLINFFFKKRNTIHLPNPKKFHVLETSPVLLYEIIYGKRSKTEQLFMLILLKKISFKFFTETTGIVF